jgi:sulfur carrier protein ThiS
MNIGTLKKLIEHLDPNIEVVVNDNGSFLTTESYDEHKEYNSSPENVSLIEPEFYILTSEY